jgi:mono/diheme cytochrome c family protein
MQERVVWSRGRVRASRLLHVLVAAAAGCASGDPAPPAPAEPAPEPALANFTAEQADRGQRVFTTVCSVCHGRNEFTGPIFSLTWRVEPVGHLFEHISTTMPQDAPGSLTAEEYASIVAYMLRLNGRQPGNVELPTDADALNRLAW